LYRHQALAFSIFTRFKPKNPGIPEAAKNKDRILGDDGNVSLEVKSAIRKKYKSLCAGIAPPAGQ